MESILSAKSPAKVYIPLIQRRFPVEPAIYRMLTADDYGMRMKGVNALIRSNAPKRNISEHLRVRLFDELLDLRYESIKAALDGKIFDPHTALNIIIKCIYPTFPILGTGGAWRKNGLNAIRASAISYVNALYDQSPSELKMAFQMFGRYKIFHLRDLFAQFERRMGIHIGPQFDFPFSFFPVAFCESLDIEPAFRVISEEMDKASRLTFAEERSFDLSILRICSQQAGVPESHVASIILDQMQPQHILTVKRPDVSEAEMKRSLEIMEHMQRSIFDWLNGNFTMIHFLFEDKKVNDQILLRILNHLRYQQYTVRFLCACKVGEVKPLLLIYLGALSNIVDNLGGFVRHTFESRLRLTDNDLGYMSKISLEFDRDQSSLIAEIRARLNNIKVHTSDISLSEYLSMENYKIFVRDAVSRLMYSHNLDYVLACPYYLLGILREISFESAPSEIELVQDAIIDVLQQTDIIAKFEATGVPKEGMSGIEALLFPFYTNYERMKKAAGLIKAKARDKRTHRCVDYILSVYPKWRNKIKRDWQSCDAISFDSYLINDPGYKKLYSECYSADLNVIRVSANQPC